jgi:hypothetical protein
MLTAIGYINKVYKILQEADFDNIFKVSKPIDETHDSYIVIGAQNATAGMLQECRIMVNVFVKDKEPVKRMMDYVKMNTMVLDIANELDNYLDGEIDIELLNHIPIRVEEKPEHYTNMIFMCRHTD